MPSLKDYRDRIVSVKSTRKITSAMKMVAASKLKKAQEKAEASQPYAKSMAEVMARVAAGVNIGAGTSPLLAGTGEDQVHLLLVVTSDRGLCGGFNGNLLRQTKTMIAGLTKAGKTIKIVTVGRKGYEFLKRDYKDLIVKSFMDIGRSGVVQFSEVSEVSEYVLALFEEGEFDVCSVLGNQFRSILEQVPTASQLIPFTFREETIDKMEDNAEAASNETPYGFEPDEEEILNELLPRNISVQIFSALLDSAAGEQAARMTAMDSATRNAGDKIKDLTLQYNRARQAYITKELIEIISGAEAVS
ncbi:MAG: F0F1 ATP synthase subunit gamma [Alphaproteobacteria bacterium]|nr:MAG: F0F1 ATP synthase subunit gamma [Alphaproteobacteria bacterium]